MEDLIQEELNRFGVPGLGVAVVKDGSIVLSQGFGVRNLERELPVTDKTLFPIGSTTKAFAATVLGCLVDDGLLEWDRPVRDYLPRFQMHDRAVTEQVTLRDMLSHRTGLPRHDLLMLMYGGGQMSRAELIERLRHLPLNKGLREAWQYNNLIYMTAGYLTEVVDGVTWEDAVRERILDPLGMVNTNFSLNESQKSDDHSEPHDERDGRITQIPFRNIEMAGPAGSINSCASDMARWLLLNLEKGTFDGNPVISAGALSEIHEPAMLLPSGASQWDESNLVGYGLGWLVEDYRGHRLIWHNGGVDGFKAVVSFVPKQRAGICVLANRFPSEAPEAIAYLLIDRLLELEPIDWGLRLHELETTSRVAAVEAREHGEARSKDAAPTHPLTDFAGAYSHPGYGRITFEVAGNELVADLHGLHVTMKHRHFNIWDAHEQVHEMIIPFSFLMDLDGEIDGVEASLEPSVDPIRFEREADAGLSDPAVLEKLSGSYELGPLTIEVEATGAVLKAALPGAGIVDLIPRRSLRFGVKGHEALSLEFVVDDQGSGKQVVIEGAGVFNRKS